MLSDGIQQSGPVIQCRVVQARPQAFVRNVRWERIRVWNYARQAVSVIFFLSLLIVEHLEGIPRHA